MQHTIDSNELDALRTLDRVLKYAEIEITPAEIKALNSSPKTLVPAPGAGQVLEFVSLTLVLDWESIAYATNGDLTVKNESGTSLSNTVLLANLLAATADKIVRLNALDPADTGVVLLENEGIQLSCATGDPTAGDSPIRAKVLYRVHETGL